MAGGADQMNGQTLSKSHPQPGTLWKRAQSAHAHALKAGALRPIPAHPETVEEQGIPFTVWRVAGNDLRLPAERARSQKPAWSETEANPFLTYDADMFVCDLTDTHVCLLNKYNILDVHLLVVTRAFEHQTRWLTLADFEALRLCMVEFEGLAFYNGGKTAGASQRHKHLQYVPFPLTPGGADLPIAAAVAEARWDHGVGTVEAFPFVHALGQLHGLAEQTPAASAAFLLDVYEKLLAASGIAQGTGDTQTQPYNLLATREWMMIVPRKRESFSGVSVNALGFAGSLLARNDAQVRTLRDDGPLSVLAHVGVARAT